MAMASAPKPPVLSRGPPPAAAAAALSVRGGAHRACRGHCLAASQGMGSRGQFWGESLPSPAHRQQPAAAQASFRTGGHSIMASKMPAPDFSGKSPESKAAENLHNFFTYIAVRIVLTQLRAYNPEGYIELKEFTDEHPNGLKDGDLFCANLMRVSPRHRQLALRIMEVRSAYVKEDFEWDNLLTVTLQRMDDANRGLLCEFVMETTKLE